MSLAIAVVIPCYRVKDHILEVLSQIGPEVTRVYTVDDACPEESGKFIQEHCKDPRVRVLFLPENRGVGGATMAGFSAALSDGMEVIVKIDGDGQMNPSLIPDFVRPILDGQADYTKGNRFHDLEALAGMPKLRLFGNSLLSFVNKAMSGYWNLMDPTNGFVAIHAAVLRLLPLDKIAPRYFFEADLLFRLNIVRAVVQEIPMVAVYGGEKSSLKISQVAMTFPPRYAARLLKRIFYNYFLRDFKVGSLEIIFGLLLLAFGSVFGAYHWYLSVKYNAPATTGTVMLAALPVILGFQLLLGAVSFDVSNIPARPLHRRLPRLYDPHNAGLGKTNRADC